MNRRRLVTGAAVLAAASALPKAPAWAAAPLEADSAVPVAGPFAVYRIPVRITVYYGEKVVYRGEVTDEMVSRMADTHFKCCNDHWVGARKTFDDYGLGEFTTSEGPDRMIPSDPLVAGIGFLCSASMALMVFDRDVIEGTVCPICFLDSYLPGFNPEECFSDLAASYRDEAMSDGLLPALS